MLNMAVLLQLIGIIVTFSIGMPGYFIGPFMLVAGGILYRREKKLRESATNNDAQIRRSSWPNILAGAVLLIGLIISAVFVLTSDMTTAADEFFLAVKNKDMDKAYSYLSEDFRSGTTKTELLQYLEANSLHKFKDASWQSRSIDGGRGSLKGSITTDSGGVVPITLSFVKGEGGWKIYSLQKPSSGVQEETSSIQIPTTRELVQLVNQSMSVFAESANIRSMAKFHAHVSNLWQQQTSPENFDEAFSAFYDSGLDLRILANFSPIFSAKPSINENSVLTITGHYPTKPNQLHFEQQYIYEGLGWKLIGFNINIE